MSENTDSEIVDEEFVDKRPVILFQYSAKDNMLRMWCKSRVYVDTKVLTPVDSRDLAKGFERRDPATNENWMAYGMAHVELSDNFRIELSEKFILGRDEALYGKKIDIESDPRFIAWNPKYKLKPIQAAMANRILTQFMAAEETNKRFGQDDNLGQGFFNCTAPGGGKTPTTIAVAIGASAKKVIVVALTSLLDQWAEELEKFHAPGFAPPTVVINSGAAEADRTEAIAEFAKVRYGWCIVGYATFRDHIEGFLASDVDYDLLVFDESGVMRNEKNQVADAAQRLIFHNTQNAYGTYNGKTRKVRFVMHLNGTPVPNHGGELWNLFRQVRAPRAIAMDKETFHERHAATQEIFIPERGITKTIKSGIYNIFELARNYGSQFGGLPKDTSALPKAIPFNITCVMNPEEEATYRALEQGYSLEVGKTSLESYLASLEKQKLSKALDEHRNVPLASGGLTQYLDLVSDKVTDKLGLATDAKDDFAEVDGLDDAPEATNDITNIEEQIAALMQEWAELQASKAPIVDRRNVIKTTVTGIREQIKALDAEEESEENALQKATLQEKIERLQTEFSELADKGKEIVATQAKIRERQHLLEEELRQLKIAERLREQTRSSTLIRLRRAAAGGEWVVKDDGTKELVVYPSAKFRWIREFVTSNPTSKILIFVSLVSTSVFLKRELEKEGIAVAVVAGNNSAKATSELRRYKSFAVTDDPNVRANVLILTCDKGTGLNLQMTRHVIFESKPYLSTTVDQNIARAVREFGTESEVNIYHLFTTFADGSPTSDHYVQNIVDKKARTSAIFGGANPKPLDLRTEKSIEQVQEEQRKKLRELSAA